MIRAAALLAGSFGVSLLMVRVVLQIARFAGFFALPNTIVKDHRRPVAKGGGMAVMGVVLGTAYLLTRTGDLPLRILLGILPTYAIGCADDLVEFPPLVKFLFQCLSVSLYLWLAPVPHWLAPIAALFLVAAQNAWNLVDVMDGLFGVIAVVCFAAMAAVFVLAGGTTGFALACISVVGSATGFLVWNAHPAQVFMGDSGCAPLGMLFGVFVLEAWAAAPRLAIPLMIAGLIPFFEVVFLIIVRTKRGIRFYHKSPDHFSHRLRGQGHPVRVIVGWVALAGAALGLLSVLSVWLRLRWVVMGTAILIVTVAWLFAHRFLARLSPNLDAS